MQIVTDNPKPWNVPVEVDESGKIVAVFRTVDLLNEARACDELLPGSTTKFVERPNFVFGACLSFHCYSREGKSVVYVFLSGDVALEFSVKAMAELHKALDDGRVRQEGGTPNGPRHLKGLFTFANHGGYLSVVPASPEEIREARLAK